MALKSYRPTTSGQRFLQTVDYRELTKTKPTKSLVFRFKKHSGRETHSGSITSRHRGGGSRFKYRMIDFMRDKLDTEAIVKTIEYDPGRSAFIALVEYKDKEKRYIIAPHSLKAGDKVMSSFGKIETKTGNCLPLKNILVGTFVHNVETCPGRGAALARSAGSNVQLQAMEDRCALLKMPSGEIRKVLSECRAVVGVVSNLDHNNVSLGKAGRKRWMGWKPQVRGKAMCPKDHPHGGGEGRNPIGLVSPKTKWGKKAFGVKTRKPKKWSNYLIVKRRK